MKCRRVRKTFISSAVFYNLLFSTPVIYHNSGDCDRFRPSDKGLGSPNVNKNRVYLPKFIWQWKTLRRDGRSFQTAAGDVLDASAVSILRRVRCIQISSSTFSVRFYLYISWMSQDCHNKSSERRRKLNAGSRDKLHLIWAFIDGEACAMFSSALWKKIKTGSQTISCLQDTLRDVCLCVWKKMILIHV